MKRTAVFISAMGWREYEANGFRTRRGAILKAWVRSKLLDHVILFVETGFRGSRGIHEIDDISNDTRITEISVSGRFPEKLVRLLDQSWLRYNYRLPPKTASLLKKESPVFIWSYSAGLGERVRRQLSAPLLYDVIDYRPADLNLSSLESHLWQKELLAGCRCADVVVCNGEPAYEALRKHTKKCVLIRNGIDSEYLIHHPTPSARQGIGFVGVISNWIDFDLLEYLLQCLSAVDFEFHGIVLTGASKLEQLRQYSNFHWHGPLPPQDVISSFTRYQVALVPYDPSSVRKAGGDSMKVFEYLAAGTPVVATDFQPRLKEKFDNLIHVCCDRAEFLDSVKHLMQQPTDPVWQEKARKFILANTWEHRLDEVSQVLSELQ